MRLLLCLLLTICSSHVFANDHYIDNTASGSNNGTSWDNAWESFADTDWSIVAAGDTVYISGGQVSQTYNITSYIQPEYGTLGNNIVIKVGQDEGYNGIVTIDGGDTVPYIFYLQYSDYITIDGEVDGERHMQLRNWGAPSGAGRFAAVHGSGAANGTDGMLIRYLNIINDDTFCDTDTCEAEVDIVRKSGIILTGSYDDGVVIEHNYIEGAIREAIIVGNATSNTFGNNIVRFNEVHGFRNHDGKGGPDGIKSVGSTDVYNNIVYHTELLNAEYNPSHIGEDGIQILAFNCRVYNNILYGYSQGPIRTDTTALTKDIQIYNNLLYVSHAEGVMNQRGIQLDGTDYEGVEIYNNTIVGFGSLGIHVHKRDGTSVDLEIRNNLLYDSDFNFTTEGGDYDDLIYRDNIVINANGSEGTSDISQSYDPYDAGKSVEFISYTANTVDNDFRLTAGSDMAINTGVTTALLTDDINGISRPQGAAYDIGAYEYILGNTGQTQAGTGQFTTGTGSLTTQ